MSSSDTKTERVLPPDKFSVLDNKGVHSVTSWNLGKPATLEEVLKVINREFPGVQPSQIVMIEGFVSTTFEYRP